MSIELKQAAQQAVDAFDAFSDADDFASLFELTRKMRALRTAIQQAEAQQPATCVPVGFTYQAEIAYANSTGGNGSFWRVPPDLDDEAVPLYDHPAPSVPADVVRVPLQVLKDASEALGNFVSDHGWGDADMQAMDNLDAYIARHEANRAARLAAK